MAPLRLRDAEALLAEALARAPSARAAQLLDDEGLVLVSTLGAGDFDDTLAAASQLLLSLGERLAPPCHLGDVQSFRMRGTERQLLVIQASGCALVVVADPYADADLIELQFSQLARRLQPAT